MLQLKSEYNCPSQQSALTALLCCESLVSSSAQGHAVSNWYQAEGDTVILEQRIIEAANSHRVLRSILHTGSTELHSLVLTRLSKGKLRGQSHYSYYCLQNAPWTA